MFDIVLYQPEIPPNVGNIIRLCANTGCRLHLIEPLGFRFDNRALKRAGLDYHERTISIVHPSFSEYLTNTTSNQSPARLFACSSKVRRCYATVCFMPKDAFLFGPETRGLPSEILVQVPSERQITIPMHTHNRSLNLANAVAVIVYEAWRQNEFAR